MGKASTTASVRFLRGLSAAFLLPNACEHDRTLQRLARNRGAVSEAKVAEIVGKTIDDIFDKRVIGAALTLTDEMRKSLQAQVLTAMVAADLPWGPSAIHEKRSLDIAASLAAFTSLVGWTAPTCLPAWLEGTDHFVRDLLSPETSTKALRDTCEARALSDLNSVGRRCLDGILAGDRIRSEEVLVSVAAVLKPHVRKEVQHDVCVRLRLHFAVRSIVETMQATWGHDDTKRWLAELIDDWRRFECLFAAMRDVRICGPGHRDNEFLKQTMVHGLQAQSGFSPLRWAVYALPEHPFVVRVREHIDGHFGRSIEPPERRARSSAIYNEMGVTQGSIALVLLMDMKSAIDGMSVDNDPAYIALQEIPRTGTRDELVEIASRLDDLQEQYPDDPRVLTRRALVFQALGEKQRAKTLASRAASSGYVVAKAVLEVPSFFD